MRTLVSMHNIITLSRLSMRTLVSMHITLSRLSMRTLVSMHITVSRLSMRTLVSIRITYHVLVCVLLFLCI